MKITIILIILTIFINAKDFFLSFSFININGKIIYTEFNCSPALSYKHSYKKFLFSFPLHKNIINTCKKYENQIIDLLLKQKIFVYSNEILNKKFLNSRIKLTFLPKRFDIIIKDKKAYFYLKENN